MNNQLHEAAKPLYRLIFSEIRLKKRIEINRKAEGPREGPFYLN